jgi:hypothetical protein
MRRMRLYLFLSLLCLSCEIRADELIANVANRRTIDLNGRWSAIVDPLDNGYSDYRYHSLFMPARRLMLHTICSMAILNMWVAASAATICKDRRISHGRLCIAIEALSVGKAARRG